MASKKLTDADVRRAAFQQNVAPGLIKEAKGPARSTRSVSKAAVFYEEDTHLGVVVDRGEAADASDDALVFALHARKSDQKITLVLPEEHAWGVWARLPWLRHEIRLWTYDEQFCVQERQATEQAVLESFDDPLVLSVHEIGECEAWVSELVAWASSHAQLKDATRSSYRAWHCAGRMVLKIWRTARNLEVIAGVDYSRPGEGKPAPLKFALQGPMSSEDLEAAKARVTEAIARRVKEEDALNEEHRLQETLARHNLLGFPLEREFPAYRARRRAYIDFLGVDAERKLRIVETKIGTKDSLLVLQGLDYWIWARAHHEALRKRFGHEEYAIDFVVQPKGRGGIAGEYTGVCLRALKDEIQFRFHQVVGKGDAMRLESMGWRQLP